MEFARAVWLPWRLAWRSARFFWMVPEVTWQEARFWDRSPTLRLAWERELVRLV